MNNIITQNKEQLNILLNYYGEFSNLVHDNFNIDVSQPEYMESIIQSNNYDFLELDSKVINILNSYETLMAYIFKINKETLSTNELVRLNRTLSSKRFKQIMHHLEKENL